MNTSTHIGINGLFLRKPGSGIGQVTKFFLESLQTLDLEGTQYTLYIDDSEYTFPVGKDGRVVYLKPLWKRDDLIRKLLWEHVQLPKEALKDGVTHFLSLYQAPTEFPKPVRHTMLVHDIIPEIFPEYRANSRTRLLWNLTKRGIRKADKIITVSKSTKSDVSDYLGVDDGKITVAYPSINPLFFQEQSIESQSKVLSSYGLEPGYIYHGGGLEIRKNTESVLMAYAAWKKSVGEGVPPLVISGTIHGAENKLATNVKDLIQKLEIEDAVRLLGFVPDEDLPALYSQASIFVFPSRYEGFGMPVVEALSQGTAVLAERNSSLGEVGGEAVYWCDSLTEETLKKNYEKAGNSSFEEKNIRIDQAGRFQGWEKFAQKICNTLLQ